MMKAFSIALLVAISSVSTVVVVTALPVPVCTSPREIFMIEIVGYNEQLQTCCDNGCQTACDFLEENCYTEHPSGGRIGTRKLSIQPPCDNPGRYCELTPELAEEICCAPPPSTTTSAGSGGDPHFKTWSGTYYDFHGQCDMVLLKNPNFEQSRAMEIHIRTKTQYEYSYIEALALQIGDEILEVGGHGNYMINGVLGTTDDNLPEKFAGYPMSVKKSDKKTHIYQIQTTKDELIEIKTFKQWVSISIVNPTEAHFGQSTGMMGEYETGRALARDGTTVLNIQNQEDVMTLGQEWQVRDSDVRLFETNDRAPQFPEHCQMPRFSTALKRRLEQSNISQQAAEEACSHLSNAQERSNCEYDVIASGDLDMAQAGAF